MKSKYDYDPNDTSLRKRKSGEISLKPTFIEIPKLKEKPFQSKWQQPPSGPEEFFQKNKAVSTITQPLLYSMGKLTSVPGAVQSLGDKFVKQQGEKRLNNMAMTGRISPQDYENFQKPIVTPFMQQNKLPTSPSEQSKALFSHAKTAQDYATKDLSGFAKSAADFGFGAVNMAADIGFSAGTGIPIGASLGLTSGAQNTQRALDEGYSAEQALLFGGLSGLTTAQIERLGGIGAKVGGSKLGNYILGKVPQKLTDGAAKLASNGFGKLVKAGLSEGAEEFAEYPVQLAIENMALNKKNPYDFKQHMANTAQGAAMGTLFGSVNTFTSPKGVNVLNPAESAIAAQKGVMPIKQKEGFEDVFMRGKKTDLVPTSRADTVPLSAAGEKALSQSDTNISYNSTAVNTQGKQPPLDFAKSNEQLKVNHYIDNAISRSRFVTDPVISDKVVPSINIGKVDSKLQNDILTSYGLDLTGYSHELSDNDLRHIYNRHGPHTNEKYPVTKEDLKQIPNIISEYDNVYLSNNNDKNGIFYEKRHNGTTFYLEAIDNGGGRLVNKQMIKVPTGTIPNVKGLKESIAKKNTTSVPSKATEVVPQMYAQDVRSDVPYNPIIPQGNNSVNTNSMQNSVENTAKPQIVQSTAKSQKYQQNKERFFLNDISKAMSIPKTAQKQNLSAVVSEIANELKTSGSISSTRSSELFDKAYQNGVEVLDDFYNQYKELKQDLRQSAISISDGEKSSIADYNAFRKSNMGTLLIKNDGVPVDVKYQELSSIYPELFDSKITSQAEQLQRISEVAKSIKKVEVSLDEYYGDNSADYKEFARHEFDKSMEKLLEEMKLVSRFETDGDNKSSIAAAPTVEVVKGYYRDMKPLEKAAQKAVSKHLLTKLDDLQVERLLKGEITVDEIATGANKAGIIEVFNAKLPIYELQKQIDGFNAARKANLREQSEELISNSEKWKDKKAGLLYSRETMERNFKDIIPDSVEAQKIIDYYFSPVHKNEANSIKMKNDYRDRIRELDLNEHESVYTQLYGELQYHKLNVKSEESQKIVEILEKKAFDYMEKHGNKINMETVNKAVSEFRGIYDELIAKVNDVLIENGYAPVEYRQGYFPHFIENKPNTVLEKLAKAVGFDFANQELPTDIAGLTHSFKPGKKWVGNFLKRTGESTDYDALKGFDRYIEGVSDVIYHTQDIQKLRDFENAIRYKYSDLGTKRDIDDVRSMDLTDTEKQAKLSELYERDMSHLPHLVTELRSYTDNLAGKKSSSDRGIEADFGRGIYKTVSNLEGRIAANMVAINPGSWLTNFIPLTQGSAELSGKSMLKAAKETFGNILKDDGFVEQSSFLTNRRGSDLLSKTLTQEVSEKLSKPMYYIDDFTANTLTRARTYDNMAKGMGKSKAISEADGWAASVIADRSKGALPTVFNRKNPITKTLTMFQVEVNNQLSYLFKDMPKAQKEKGIAALSWSLVKYLLGAYLYNELYEKLTGRRAALDPIGMVKDSFNDFTNKDVKPSAAIKNTSDRVIGQLPFIGGIWGGGRLPISSAFPDFGQLAKVANPNEDIAAKKKLEIGIKELGKPLAYLALPFGGGQIKKTLEGVGAVSKGGSYTYDNEGQKKLQFPVFNSSLGEYAKGALFGKYALPEAKKYVEGGFNELSAKQTKAYDSLVADKESRIKAFEDILKIKDIGNAEEQRELLLNLDLKPKQKSMLDDLLISELTNKLDYTNRDSFEISKLSEKRQSEAKQLLDLGVPYNSFLKINQKRAELDKKYKDKAGSEKNASTELSKWLDENVKLSGEQRTAVDEVFRFWSMIPQTPEQYNESTLSESNSKLFANEQVKTVFGGDAEKFIQAQNILTEIKADKDEYGNSISNTSKPKEIEAISKQLEVSTQKATDIYNELVLFKHSTDELSSKEQKALETLKSKKMSEKSFLKYSNLMRTIESDKGSDGKTISGSLKNNRFNALVEGGMPEGNARYFLSVVYGYVW